MAEQNKTTPDGPLPLTPSVAKRALAWTHTARFLTTASQLDQLPPTELPEIAFVGRSNAGKSTAINTLTQQKRLAFASKTPGRTQHINLFELGPRLTPDTLFADLPGYGYAAVARGAKLRWQKVMADYLEVRRSLAGVVLMVDARLGLHRHRSRPPPVRDVADGQRFRQAAGAARPRSTSSTAGRRRAQWRSDAGCRRTATDESDLGVALFSALSRPGVEDVAILLRL